MSEILTIYQSNDTIIEMAGLKNELSGLFVNNAVVNVVLKDSLGANVAGQVWPLALNYVTDSLGVYRATLGFALPLLANKKYTANVFVSAGGLVGNWAVEVICKVRK